MSKPLTCLLSLLTQETLDTGTEHALHRKDTFFPLSLSLLPPPRLCATVSVSFLLTPYQRLAPPHLVYSHLTEITWWAKGRFISDYGLSSGTLLACPDLRMLLGYGGRSTHVGKRQSQSWRHSTRGTYTSVTYPLGVAAVSRRRRTGDEFPPCCCHVVRNT